jgi:muramoyltetrapeptide carboxypeptidase
MLADRLIKGGCIGIVSPCHVGNRQVYERVSAVLNRLGFSVKHGKNMFKDTYGYAASTQERVEDFNDMIADDEVQMILFSGGEGSVELLPYIDYKNISAHPKLVSSYSDGTPILNAIYAQTGLITYYGADAGEFVDLRQYDYAQFCEHFVSGYEARQFVSDSDWKVLCEGDCEGIIIGGYASEFAMMQSNRYFNFDPQKKYLLILEEHERFSVPEAVASFLGFIEQSPIMKNITGLVFGQFSVNENPILMGCLQRFGERNHLPVVYSNDFGHGTKHGILPLGRYGRLNTNNHNLLFGEW